MKKMMAALAAAAMLCCTLVSPVSAEETYRKGDVNMDGVVDCTDSQLVLTEYAEVVLACNKGILSEEQRELARVVSPETLEGLKYEGDSVFMLHAWAILAYYAAYLTDSSIADTDVGTWFTQYWDEQP